MALGLPQKLNHESISISPNVPMERKKALLTNFYQPDVPTGRLPTCFGQSGRLVGSKNKRMKVRSIGTPGEIINSRV